MRFDVVISYAREDFAEAERLERALTAERLVVFRDINQVQPGERFPDKVAQAIDSCEAVVWLGSESSLKSKWVERELDYATEAEKPIVPLYLNREVREHTPGRLRILFPHVAYVDLEESGWDEGVAAVVRGLREGAVGAKAIARLNRGTGRRLHRSQHLDARRSVSLLAMMETAAALILLTLSVIFGSYWFIACVSLTGWVMLLRTTRSTIRGIWLFDPAYRLYIRLLGFYLDYFQTSFRPSPTLTQPAQSDRSTSSSGNPLWFLNPLAYALLALGATFGAVASIAMTLALIGVTLVLMLLGLATRSVATIWTTIESPQSAARAIPGNWRRIVFVTDSTARLEIVPGHTRFVKLSRAKHEADDVLCRFLDVRPETLFAELRHPLLVSACLLGFAALVLLPAVGKRVLAYENANAPSLALGAPIRLYGPDRHNRTLPRISSGSPAAPSQDAPATITNADTRSPRQRYRDLIDEHDRDRKSRPSGGDREADKKIEPPRIRFEIYDDKINTGRDWLRQAADEHFGSSFDPADWVHWFWRVDWYSRWPVRQWGEWYGPKLLSFVLWCLLWTFLCAALAAYFGAWCLVITYSLQTPLRLIIFLPAIWYRLALKTTAVLYFPIIWVCEEPVVSGRAPIKELELFRTHPSSRLGNWASIIFGLLLTAKSYVRVTSKSGGPGLSDHSPLFGEEAILIHSWEISLALCVLATFVLWYFVEDAISKYRAGDSYPIGTAARVVRRLARLRNGVAAYTTISFAYGWIRMYGPWPIVDLFLFPWQPC
jgi:hypothetical protein